MPTPALLLTCFILGQDGPSRTFQRPTFQVRIQPGSLNLPARGGPVGTQTVPTQESGPNEPGGPGAVPSWLAGWKAAVGGLTPVLPPAQGPRAPTAQSLAPRQGFCPTPISVCAWGPVPCSLGAPDALCCPGPPGHLRPKAPPSPPSTACRWHTPPQPLPSDALNPSDLFFHLHSPCPVQSPAPSPGPQ